MKVKKKKYIFAGWFTMSVLADKIEQFILHKLLEEDNSDIENDEKKDNK